MPVVSKQEFWIPDKDGNVIHGEKVTIKFSARNNEFSIEVPEHFVDLNSNRHIVTSDTMDGVIENFNNLCKKYKEMITKKEKMIGYMFDSKCIIMRPDEKTCNGERCVLRRDGVHFAKGTAVNFDYIIVNKYVTGDKIVYRGVRKDGDDYCLNSSHDYKYIPWTREREEFFAKMKYAFEELILKLDNFFEKEDQWLKLIDSGRASIPMLSERKTK